VTHLCLGAYPCFECCTHEAASRLERNGGWVWLCEICGWVYRYEISNNKWEMVAA
jgi:RNase P subunit RPR2